MRLVKLYTGAFLEYEYIYVNPKHVIALEDAYDNVECWVKRILNGGEGGDSE